MQSSLDTIKLTHVPPTAVVSARGIVYFGGGLTCDLTGAMKCSRGSLRDTFEVHYARTGNILAAMSYIAPGEFTVPLEKVAAAVAGRASGLSIVANII